MVVTAAGFVSGIIHSAAFAAALLFAAFAGTVFAAFTAAVLLCTLAVFAALFSAFAGAAFGAFTAAFFAASAGTGIK